jgi:hypothetical protein
MGVTMIANDAHQPIHAISIFLIIIKLDGDASNACVFLAQSLFMMGKTYI